MQVTRDSSGKLFPILIVLLIFIVENQSKILILHKLNKNVVFNTTDDIEIRASVSNENPNQNQLQPERAYLRLSEPLDACSISSRPPLFPSTNYYSSEESSIPQVKWVALITGGGCDLKTKAVFAAQAGYSRVIIKITHPDDVFGYKSLFNDTEIQIDISLLNPADWDTIQKYVYPKRYIIILPAPMRTAQEVSFLTWTLRSIFDFFDFAVHSTILRNPFLISISLIAIYFSAVLFGDIRDYLKDLREILRERERARADNNFQWAPPPPPDQPENEEPPPRHENQQRRENPRPPVDFYRACALIFRYRNILGLPYIGFLSRNVIEKAYKQGAMKWHPDKHPEKQGAALEEITSKFREIKEARDVLMKLVEHEE